MAWLPLCCRSERCTVRVTERYDISKDHPGLMFAVRIILAHFSLSSTISLPKSAGEPERTALPNSARRPLKFASATIRLISLLSLSMISVGVFLGAHRPCNPLVRAMQHGQFAQEAS